MTQVANLAYGTWCFRARSVDTGGLTSDNSGTVWKQFIAPPKPQAGAGSFSIEQLLLSITQNNH